MKSLTVLNLISLSTLALVVSLTLASNALPLGASSKDNRSWELGVAKRDGPTCQDIVTKAKVLDLIKNEASVCPGDETQD
ncbi:hypothetical protein F5H01DRAFT_350002 [Linnemannia elongata]|nr:hypothetical protein F5H01DRAFT_360137 [Linnemannia elongata]KAK5809701.1 hypothetical protein F5H01DRAFT_350002 [Linnemannia elongata]